MYDGRRKWILWFCFPYPLSYSLSVLDLRITFCSVTRSVKLAENNRPIATGIAPFMQQNLHATQISSFRRWDRCHWFLLQKRPIFKNVLIIYLGQSTCKTLNWVKSFLFFILLLKHGKQSLVLFLQENGRPSFP